MNLQFSTIWYIKDIPTEASLFHFDREEAAYPFLDLEQNVAAFPLQLPVFRGYRMERPFPGGTMRALLRFIYDVYQERIPLQDLVGRYPLEANHLAEFRNRVEGGQDLLRVDVVGRASAFEGIQNNVLLLD